MKNARSFGDANPMSSAKDTFRPDIADDDHLRVAELLKRTSHRWIFSTTTARGSSPVS